MPPTTGLRCDEMIIEAFWKASFQLFKIIALPLTADNHHIHPILFYFPLEHKMSEKSNFFSHIDSIFISAAAFCCLLLNDFQFYIL